MPKRLAGLYSLIVRLLRDHPAAALNIGVAGAVLVGAYFLYAGKVVCYGDAIQLLSPSYADSGLGWISKMYVSWDGRIGCLLGWVIGQRWVHLAGISNPLEYPWWLDIGITQFALFCAPMNVAIWLSRTFQVGRIQAVLLGATMLAVWSLNPVIFGYTLNCGNGRYCLGSYFLSLMLVLFSRNRGFPLRVGTYVLFAAILSSYDLLVGPAFVFFLLYVAKRHVEETDHAKKSRLIREAIASLCAFGVFALIVLLSPGFSNRMKIIGNTANTASSGLERVPIYFERLTGNSWRVLVETVWTPAPTSLILFHAFISILFAGLWMGQFNRHWKKNDPTSRNILLFSLATFIAFHLTFFRTFISLYHGPYANDNPCFMLCLFVLMFYLLISRLSSSRSIMLSLIPFSSIIVFVLLPNLLGSLDSIRRARAESAVLISNYRIISDLGRISADRKSIVRLYNVSRPGIDSDISQMLGWSGIERNVSISSAGTSRATSTQPTDLVSCMLPLKIPLGTSVYHQKEPLLLRSFFNDGEACYDYLIPEFTIGYDIQLSMFPSIESSSLYQARYTYRILFSTGYAPALAGGTPAEYIKQTTLAHAPAPYTSSPVEPLSAVWLVDDVETSVLMPGRRRLLRLRVAGGDAHWAHASSRLNMSALK